MHAGLVVGVTLLALGILFSRACAQEVPTQTAVSVESSTRFQPNASSVVRTASDRLPESFRTKLLIWTISFSGLTALVGYFARKLDWQVLTSERTCLHCVKIHRKTGPIALVADVGTGASFFFLASLPFLSAIRALGYPLVDVASAVLLGLALLFLIQLAGTILTLINPKKTSTNPFIVGLRFAGLLLSVAILANGLSVKDVSNSLTTMFSTTLGLRLLDALSGESIRDAAVVLLVSTCLSGFMRWIMPFLAGSRPLFLLRADEPVHAPKALARS